MNPKATNHPHHQRRRCHHRRSPATMAASTTAIGSCFSAAITPCIRSKLVVSDTFLLKVASSRSARVLATAHHAWMAVPFYENRQRLSRIRSAVAEEEAAPVGMEGEVVVKEEEEAGGGVGEEMAPPPPEEPLTKLYFGNLPYNCDSAQLAGIVQEHATPEIVEVLYNSDTGRSRGFAFVTMNSVEDCELVIKNLDGTQYGGRTLRVNFSDKPKPKLPLYPESDYKLFVGNLSWSVTSESLTKVFEEYGNVVGARVLYDGDTGRSRGYGFVCYSTKEEMDAALESLDGVELEGRNLRISLALGKKT